MTTHQFPAQHIEDGQNEDTQMMHVQQPPLEIVVHQAGMVVNQIPLPDGTRMWVLQLITPALAISVKLSEDGKRALMRDLSGGIAVASIVPG